MFYRYSFDQQSHAVRNIIVVLLALIMGLTLSSCALKVQDQIENPTSVEKIPVGLLDIKTINDLPAGEVKDSFLAELNDVKEDCAKITGCMGDTVQIYRVVTKDNVFSYRFANVDDDNGLRTQILSVIDGKTKEKTEINEDLVAIETEIEGIPTRVFGYVDDEGNSHYMLVGQEKNGGDEFTVFDVQGNPYDVITQNEKEVQAYSHLWEAPSIVQAEALPTNTPTAEVTPTEAVSFEKYTFQKGDTMESVAAKYNISVSDLLSADEERIHRLIPDGGYIGQEIPVPSRGLSQEVVEEIQKELFDDAPEVEGYTKENYSNGFVYYKNIENGKVDRVWDQESGKIMGYFIAENGTVLLTEQTVLKESGQLLVDPNKEDAFSEAISLWKERFIEQGNPYGITKNTPIQLEYKDWWAETWTERLRPVTTWGEDSGGWGYSMAWTESGSLRLILSLSSRYYTMLGDEVALNQPSIFTAVLLFYTEPNSLGASYEDIPHLIKMNTAYWDYQEILLGTRGSADLLREGAVIVR